MNWPPSFRYDVVLHVGRPVPLLECPWIDWSAENLSLERLREILGRDSPSRCWELQVFPTLAFSVMSSPAKFFGQAIARLPWVNCGGS